MQTEKREHWASTFGFIMAAAGSAIGLGTLWQFPYMTGQNGGGLFVILFLVFTAFIGMPLFIAELVLGRKAQRGAVGVFQKLAPHSEGWKLAGWLSVSISFLILSYYCVVAGWGLNYVFMCLNQFYLGKTSQEIAGVFDILHKASGINIFWQVAFLLLSAGVVLKGVKKGIEFWSRILTSTLLVILLALLLYSITLSGFKEACRFIFYPDLSKLRVSGVLEALGMAFYTLSLGQGIMLTYGSYMKHTENIPKTAVIVSVVNLVVSIAAALMIFPIIFTFNLPAQGGVGLVFKTLPVLFAQLPGALILSTTFFILLVFTALTSNVALIEVITANFMDMFRWSRTKSVLFTSLAGFIFGIPSALSGSQALFPDWMAVYGKTFFSTVVDLVAEWLLPFSGLFVALFLGWKVGAKDCFQEFCQGTRWQKIFATWFFFTKWIAPVAIFLILLQRGGIIDLDAWFS